MWLPTLLVLLIIRETELPVLLLALKSPTRLIRDAQISHIVCVAMVRTTLSNRLLAVWLTLTSGMEKPKNHATEPAINWLRGRDSNSQPPPSKVGVHSYI